MDLQHKIAIITGGSGGLGMAAAKAFLAKGAKVAVFDLQEGEVKTLAEAHPGQIKYYETDVISEENVATNIDQVVEDFGAIRCLHQLRRLRPQRKDLQQPQGSTPTGPVPKRNKCKPSGHF